MSAGFLPPPHDTREAVCKNISPHLQAELGWWQGDVANEPPIQENMQKVRALNPGEEQKVEKRRPGHSEEGQMKHGMLICIVTNLQCLIYILSYWLLILYATVLYWNSQS